MVLKSLQTNALIDYSGKILHFNNCWTVFYADTIFDFQKKIEKEKPHWPSGHFKIQHAFWNIQQNKTKFNFIGYAVTDYL